MYVVVSQVQGAQRRAGVEKICKGTDRNVAQLVL